MIHLQDEETLIAQCVSGKRDAQYTLYKKYSTAMYNICLRMVSDQSDAEDVLQVSFVQVFSKINEYRYESTIGAWIKRIVVNNCINHLRKNNLRFESIEDKEVIMYEDEPVEYDVSSIKRAISQLPEGYKAIFCLYTLEGYDHGEIGQIMNISESTSKSQYSRARAKLCEILRNNGSINKIYQ